MDISSVSSDENSDMTQSRRTPASLTQSLSIGTKQNKSHFSMHKKNMLSDAPLLEKEPKSGDVPVKKIPPPPNLR